MRLDELQKHAARFWANVERRTRDECWLWRGYTDEWGYGVFNVGGHHLLAHRAAYMLGKHIDDPGGWYVCHKCDRPKCVNPRHLSLGTAHDNVLDCISKGRHSGHARKSQTHCKRNHPLSGANVYLWRGIRYCRTCHHLHQAANRARTKKRIGVTYRHKPRAQEAPKTGRKPHPT